jgi:hypothetical protein
MLILLQLGNSQGKAGETLSSVTSFMCVRIRGSHLFYRSDSCSYRPPLAKNQNSVSSLNICQLVRLWEQSEVAFTRMSVNRLVLPTAMLSERQELNL